MATETENVNRAVTGMVMVGALDAAAPTGTAFSTSEYTDLGWISDAGVSRSMPGAGDRDVIRGWQNNGIVVVIRTPSEDNPTYTFVCLESKKEVIEFALNTTVTQSATEGSYVVDAHKESAPRSMIIDVLNGDRIRRTYAPRVVRTEVGDQVLAFGEVIGHEVTVEVERDDDLGTEGGHFIEWDTALKTPA